MYETNMKCIERRMSAGLERLRRDYELIESDIGELERFTVDSRVHAVRRFEVKGVGNLVCMTNPEPGAMQMDSFVLTPYCKNLPLFTSDYMYFGEKRGMLNEIYSLVAYEDELYTSYIERFAENCRRYEYLPEMPLRPCWYDSIRPVVIARSTGPEDDDAIFELFMSNLEIFIEMEKASPRLEGGALKAKWEKNYGYARALVEDGGVSTELFVKSLGEEKTKEFFYSVFFGPDNFREGI